jgi:hypothetical protein
MRDVLYQGQVTDNACLNSLRQEYDPVCTQQYTKLLFKYLLIFLQTFRSALPFSVLLERIKLACTQPDLPLCTYLGISKYFRTQYEQ